MAKTKKKTKKTAVKIELDTSSNALDRAIAQIEKQYGSGSIMKMDESTDRASARVPCRST